MTDETSIKVIKFTKAKDWLSWKEMFLAKLGQKNPKVRDCFKLEEEFLTETTSTEQVVLKKVEENKKIMESAYAQLLLSMSIDTTEGNVGFNIVRRSKRNGTGDARLAFERLIKRFEPQTPVEKGKLLEKFYSSKCKTNQDPESYIYELEELKGKIEALNKGSFIDEDAFMTHVLYSLPRGYDGLVEMLQKDLNRDDADDEKLTVESMAEQLSAKFVRMKVGRAQEEVGAKEEVALVGFNRQFKGKCHYCGKLGHKSVDCWERKRDENDGKPKAMGKPFGNKGPAKRPPF